MNKVVDSKFFKFVGADMRFYEDRVGKIEKRFWDKYGIKSICDINENGLIEELADVLRKKYFPDGVSVSIWKEMFGSFFWETLHKYEGNEDIADIYKRSIDESEMVKINIYKTNIYKTDVDYAVFLLLGSYLSEWSSISVFDKNLPFSIEKMKKRNGGIEYVADCASAWCKALQNVFKKTTLSFLLQDIDTKTRVEKFSYFNISRLRDELDTEIRECRDEQEKASDRITDNIESESHNSFFYMTDDGIENQIVLDMLLNISLSEICYFHLRNKGQLDWKYIESLVQSLTKLKCPVLRNQIADGLFTQLLLNEIKGAAYWEQMIKEFDLIVTCINYIYTSLVYKAWTPIYSGINQKDEKELWKEIIQSNCFAIQKLSNPQYEKVLRQDIYNERGIILFQEGGLKKDTVLHQYEMLNNLFSSNEKYDMSYLGELKIKENDIEKINNEKLKEAEKRGHFKNAKSASELYIKLQCIMRDKKS